ncbi:MAG: phosphoribosylaminoimidazolesuccinocarboxamide synthase, partial [Candidatus Altiarchaeota archaeon]
FFGDTVGNHLISADISDFPMEVQEKRDLYAGRTILVKKTEVIPIECVVRGYLSGSGWKQYQKEGTVCGIDLSKGLKESDRLPEPIFTPSTKEESGHDINITFDKAKDLVGEDVSGKIRDYSISIYKKAATYAGDRGIIIADTKFEFGLVDNEVILIDEVLTPDSSRFWPVDQYVPGKPQPSFDKQFVRDYVVASGWDKEPPAPSLPSDVVEGTTKRYLEAYEKITGCPLSV